MATCGLPSGLIVTKCANGPASMRPRTFSGSVMFEEGTALTCESRSDSASRVSLRGMPKFVMLSTLGPDGSARLADSPERLREVSTEVEAMGVKVLAQYTLLGNWDFLNILEAPDEVTMMKVATRLAARGT